MLAEGAIQFILKVCIHDIQYGLLKKLQLRVPSSNSHSSQRFRFYINSFSHKYIYIYIYIFYINSNTSMPRQNGKKTQYNAKFNYSQSTYINK